MPRPLRIKGNNIHYHVILRCNNREFLFGDSADFNSFLKILGNAKQHFPFRLYNYELLNSHVHLLISTHGDCFIDQVMHDVCFKFAKDYNFRHGRTGHFWAHRYRSHLIRNDTYALACLRYQHRNALAAGLVGKQGSWPWSGYRFYVSGEKKSLLELHPVFVGLSNDQGARRKIYQNLVCQTIPADCHRFLVEKAKKIDSRRFDQMAGQVANLRRQLSTTMGSQAPYGR